MQTSLVSVIIPTYQRPHLLLQAMQSVAQQTHQACEIIVVNDGGMPVEAVVAAFQQASALPVTLVNLPENGGGSVARNAGAAQAQGDFIALLDDDDRFYPSHLTQLLCAFEDQPEAVLTYDDVLIQLQDVVGATSQVIATCRFGVPYHKATFDVDDYIITSSCLIKRSAFEAVQGFDEALRMCEDWDLLLRLREQGALLYSPGEIGIAYSFRLHASDHAGSIFDERRRAALDYLSQRYHLPPLVPKTFYDVARDLGFQFTPVVPGES